MNGNVWKNRHGFEMQFINQNQNDSMHLKWYTGNYLTNYDSKGDQPVDNNQ